VRKQESISKAGEKIKISAISKKKNICNIEEKYLRYRRRKISAILKNLPIHSLIHSVSFGVLMGVHYDNPFVGIEKKNYNPNNPNNPNKPNNPNNPNSPNNSNNPNNPNNPNESKSPNKPNNPNNPNDSNNPNPFVGIEKEHESN
jgi:hypothetical protein